MSENLKIPGRSSPSTQRGSYADRLDDLAGTELVYVDWGKPNGDKLFEAFDRLFADEFDVESIEYYCKPTPSSPIPGEMLAEIMESEPDGVILAIADCGSCNSSVVVDAKSFESEGIPTVQIITDKFLDLNSKIAASHGYEKLPLITVDHPTRYLDDDEVEALAHRIMWSVNTQLTCEECLLLPEEDDGH